MRDTRENKITKKVIDYVLMESYAQKHVKSCLVQNKLDFGSDHRLIQTEMHTPTSRRARKWQKKQKPAQKPEPKSLSNNQI